MTIRNVILRKTTQRACSVRGAIVEDVRLHELNRLRNIPLFFWSVVFRRVVLSGKVSGIKINNVREPSGSRNQPLWNNANKEFYQTVDWALDISKAEFQGSISLEAIPGSLIRRDEETQVLVKRSQLEQGNWRSLDFGHSAYNVCIDWFLSDSPYEDVVLVAAKRGKKLKEELQVLAMLRREGIAI